MMPSVVTVAALLPAGYRLYTEIESNTASRSLPESFDHGAMVILYTL